MNGDGDMREQAIKTRDNNLVSSCLLLKRFRSPRGRRRRRVQKVLSKICLDSANKRAFLLFPFNSFDNRLNKSRRNLNIRRHN